LPRFAYFRADDGLAENIEISAVREVNIWRIWLGPYRTKTAVEVGLQKGFAHGWALLFVGLFLLLFKK